MRESPTVRLNVAIVTKPFHFEGTQRMRRALEGCKKLGQHVDTLITILNDKLTLYPGRSLVQNIGMDSSGTNAGGSQKNETELAERPPQVGLAPTENNRSALRQLKTLHVSWRRGWSRRTIE